MNKHASCLPGFVLTNVHKINYKGKFCYDTKKKQTKNKLYLGYL